MEKKGGGYLSMALYIATNKFAAVLQNLEQIPDHTTFNNISPKGTQAGNSL